MDLRRIETLWSHVHWLCVLGTLGSFTAAAQRLGVSKAAMSLRISELERAAGVPLVLRTTRSVRLTEAGQQLADATGGAFEAIGTAFAGSITTGLVPPKTLDTKVTVQGAFVLGEEVAAFEREAAAFLGVEHAIGVSSGSDALLVALKTASETLREHFLSAVSTRAAQAMRDDLANMPPTRLADVESAQREVVESAMRLVADGRLSLPGRGEKLV